MNDDIKKILDKCKRQIKNDLDYRMSPYQLKQLLDYITNLQQENEKLKDIIEHKPFFDFTTDIYDELEDYKSRCEKAVEYIKKHIEKCNIDGYEGKFDNFDIFTKPQKLLNILNGRSDE